MACNPSTNSWRRRVNSWAICRTHSREPLIAARAPNWAKLQTLLVLWLCKALAAATTEGGPASQPMRQPVIAQPLAKPLTMKVRSARSGAMAAKL